jgi:hypothetical protein
VGTINHSHRKVSLTCIQGTHGCALLVQWNEGIHYSPRKAAPPGEPCHGKGNQGHLEKDTLNRRPTVEHCRLSGKRRPGMMVSIRIHHCKVDCASRKDNKIISANAFIKHARVQFSKSRHYCLFTPNNQMHAQCINRSIAILRSYK